MDKYRGDDWCEAMVEQVSAIITEARFTIEEQIIRTKHMIGETIVQNEDKAKVGELIAIVAGRLNVSVRSIEQAVQFYRFDPELKTLEQGKNISWRKVLKKMQLPNPKKECEHDDVITLLVCSNCGAKVAHDKEK